MLSTVWTNNDVGADCRYEKRKVDLCPPYLTHRAYCFKKMPEGVSTIFNYSDYKSYDYGNYF